MTRRKNPKCKIGFPCGKTCISRKRKCYANLSNKDNQLAETFGQFIDRLVGIQPSSSLTAGVKESIIPAPSKENEQELIEFFENSTFFQKKLEKVKSVYQGLSDLEAMGIATWVSWEYSKMNYLLYSKDLSDEEINSLGRFAAANYHATQGLNSGKVTKYTREKMEELVPDSEKNKLNENGILVRGVDIDPSKIMERYENALGKEITEETFLATSAYNAKDFGFTSDTPVLYEIVPKSNSNGSMVDYGKNSLIEAEVLYAPGQKFKVVSIDKPKYINHTFEEIIGLNKLTEEKFKEMESLYNFSDMSSGDKKSLFFLMAGKMSLEDFIKKSRDIAILYSIPKNIIEKIFEFSNSLSQDNLDVIEGINSKGEIIQESPLKLKLKEI